MDMPETNILQHLEKTNAFITTALASGGKVLVHCHAGVSRSASIAIAYIMKTQSLPYDAAFAECGRGRPLIK
jgi:protein-tyrosine phosphatase